MRYISLVTFHFVLRIMRCNRPITYSRREHSANSFSSFCDAKEKHNCRESKPLHRAPGTCMHNSRYLKKKVLLKWSQGRSFTRHIFVLPAINGSTRKKIKIICIDSLSVCSIYFIRKTRVERGSFYKYNDTLAIS